VLETTDGGKELVDALVSIARGVMPNVAVQKSSRPRKDQQVRPADQLKAIEMLLDRGFGRVLGTLTNDNEIEEMSRG
jgi:hypothetical protein